MKILVTGATGFIGSHVIEELLKDKNNCIIATSRHTSKAMQKKWVSKVKYLEYDLNNNKNENLYELFGKPDMLIHLSWEGLPDYDNLIHIEKNVYNNYNFIKNFIKNGLKNISVAGTCFEYGMMDGKLNENMNTNPSNSYAIGKDTLRRFIEDLQKNFNFNFKWIRLFYMYGEGQSKKSLLSLVDQAIQNGDKEFNMSKGEQLRDYLHISEVASNIVSIAQQKDINGIINCCSGNPISVRSLVEKYLEENNNKLKLNLGYYQYSNYESMAFWGDKSKLELIQGI